MSTVKITYVVNMTKNMNEIKYYDRTTGKVCSETVMGDASIRWAYQTMSGRALSGMLFGNSFLSRLLGLYFDSPHSKKKIAGVISDLGINPDEFAQPLESFKSFNEFFTRKLKEEARPFSQDKNCFLSPADGRLLVYENINNLSSIKVKGIEDSLENLFAHAMREFHDGKVAVIRLCPADYHRYHVPCDGVVTERVDIKGKYYSVNPIALESKKRIFCMNRRSYTLIDTEIFGKIAYMEIGAFGVGGIHQTFTGNRVERMQEKGYFDFGGSTIVLVFQKNTIKFDSDLIENSQKGIETLVKVGETIAHCSMDSI